MQTKQSKKRTDSVVEAARKQVGYRSQPDRKSAFASRKEYIGQPWSGAFIQRVLTDAFGTKPEVSFVSTVTALGFYAARNGLYRKPRVGDVVFFNFATDPQHPFEQPHAGIVVELRPNGAFRTVEGETAPGTPQGSQLVDAVAERIRYPTDILAVIRPNPMKRLGPPTAEVPTVKMSYFDSNPKTKSKAVAAVQTALNRVLGTTFREGKLNGETKSAFGLYARRAGWVENRGTVSHLVLDVLADETGMFEVDS